MITSWDETDGYGLSGRLWRKMAAPGGRGFDAGVGNPVVGHFDDFLKVGTTSLVDGYIDGDEVECPLHGARFSIPTGAVLAEPATENLATYPVRVENDLILVGIPANINLTPSS